MQSSVRRPEIDDVGDGRSSREGAREWLLVQGVRRPIGAQIGKITFDDHGQNTVAVITKYVVQDGKFVEWEDSEYATGKRKLPGQK